MKLLWRCGPGFRFAMVMHSSPAKFKPKTVQTSMSIIPAAGKFKRKQLLFCVKNSLSSYRRYWYRPLGVRALALQIYALRPILGLDLALGGASILKYAQYIPSMKI